MFSTPGKCYALTDISLCRHHDHSSFTHSIAPPAVLISYARFDPWTLDSCFLYFFYARNGEKQEIQAKPQPMGIDLWRKSLGIWSYAGTIARWNQTQPKVSNPQWAFPSVAIAIWKFIVVKCQIMASLNLLALFLVCLTWSACKFYYLATYT